MAVEDTKLRERVAVKMLKIAASAAEKEEFLIDAEMLLTLNHPNVIRVG